MNRYANYFDYHLLLDEESVCEPPCILFLVLLLVLFGFV